MKPLALTRKDAPSHWVGNGFPVRSIFSYDDLGSELDPFLLLDYAEPHAFPPGREKRGVGSHPHRGFETVTLAFHGEITHRDSHGGGGTIGPGDVQWMTAGAGLLHEEFHSEAFTERGGLFQMVQLWINLPARNKDAPPRYQSLAKANIPMVTLPEQGGSLRVVAGRFGDVVGPAQTFTPIDLFDVHLTAGHSLTWPRPQGHTGAALVMSGHITTGNESLQTGSLAVYQRDDQTPTLTAHQDAHLLLMGGFPLGEPIVGRGPFVMNTEDEIRQAYRDFQENRMGQLT